MYKKNLFIYFSVSYYLTLIKQCLFTTHSEMRKVLFLASSVCGFSFVYEISPEPLNGFAPNSHGRRVWSLARMSLKVKIKSQGHSGA